MTRLHADTAELDSARDASTAHATELSALKVEMQQAVQAHEQLLAQQQQTQVQPQSPTTTLYHGHTQECSTPALQSTGVVRRQGHATLYWDCT